MLSDFRRSRSTRRTATVTISAPDASIARAIVSLSRYFPVPTMRREWNERPPMVNGVSRIVSIAVVMRSTPSHEMHQLDRVARPDGHCPERRTPHDRAVVLHDDDARVERERFEQLEQRGAPRHRARLPIHRDVDHVVHLFSSSSIRRAASAGSAASQNALIAATPWIAAAALSSGIRWGVTPPMTMTGTPTPTICFSRAVPSGARSEWVAVGNTGP